MQRLTLERQADVIETVLAAHKIDGRVWGGTVTPRFVRYDLTAKLGTRLQKVLALRDEIAISLGVAEIRLYRKGGAIRVEVPRSGFSTVRLLSLCEHLPKIPALTAVLGVDEEGVPLLLRLPSPDVAHVLIAGTTGSGKTALMRSILMSLAMMNPQSRLQMALVDPKGRGFGPLSAVPHLIRPVIEDSEKAVGLMRGLVVEMERRDKEKRDVPALILAIDELADLRQTGGKQVEDLLSRLTQRGREAGIHVIVATQRPAASVVGSLVKANLPVRLVGAVGSPEDAKVATGIAQSGAERLRGRGDFLLVNKGETIRMQAAFASEQELIEQVRAMQRNGLTRQQTRSSLPQSAEI